MTAAEAANIETTPESEATGVVTKILLIDDDEAVRTAIIDSLKSVGLDNITEAEDGGEAWELMQKTAFDIILTDWKMPEVSGLTLVNRIRQTKQTKDLPILVLSGYLSREDFRLLDEYPLIGKVEKPFDRETIENELTKLLSEQKWFKEQNDSLVKMFQNLPNGDEQSIQDFSQLIKSSPKPLPVALEGVKILNQMGRNQDAEHILQVVLEANPDNLLAMNELGKSFIKQNKYKEALTILEQAHSLCPQNLERLCLLGKANLNLQNNTEARVNFNAALTIDQSSQLAQDGIEITNSLDSFKASANPDELKQSFASILNSIGIAKVRDSKFNEGLEHYKSAIKIVDHHETQAKLIFNFALGLVRFRKQQEAQKWFQKAIGLAGGEYAKASRQIEIIRKSSGMDSSEFAAKFGAEDCMEEDDIQPSFVAPEPSDSDADLDLKAADFNGGIEDTDEEL